MSTPNDKLRRFRYKLKHNFLLTENIVLLVALAMCLIWTYQSIVAITKNWALSEELTMARNELSLLEIEVETAELENEYYSSTEYQELQARRLLDKQTAGEKMVALPENSTTAKTKHAETSTAVTKRDYTNFEKWLMYLFPDI